MKKGILKSVLVSALALATAFSACSCKTGEYQIKSAELPCYVYTDGATECDYNKELFYRNDINIRFGDPTLTLGREGEDEGYIYMSGTTGGGTFSAYRTKNLIDWEFCGPMLDKPSNFFGYDYFVAPEYCYDPNAKYEDYGIEKEPGEDGVGLYVLVFTARSSPDNMNLTYGTHLGVAFSKSPRGPFTFYEGVNKNGVEVDASVPVFDIEYINPQTGINVDMNSVSGQELYKPGRNFNDAQLFVDPVTGDKYMYLKSTTDYYHDIYGVKMKDWVSPDYSTFTRLTSHGWTKTIGSEGNEKYDWQAPTGYTIDEGAYTYYRNGTYYLTFSMGGTSTKRYPVIQALGDSPLGPFTKVQPKDGGFVVAIEDTWDMHCSGHHSLVELDGELWIAYHTKKSLEGGAPDSRGPAFDKVLFKTNSKGQEIMVANGPSRTIRPLPKAFSENNNVATLASVKASSGDNVEALTDEAIKMHIVESILTDFETKKKTTITLEWEKPVLASAIMVYNSCDYEKIFESIERVEISYYNENGERGIAYYDDWAFDLEGNLVDITKVVNVDEYEEEELKELIEMRGSGAAIMEFNELKIDKIELTLNVAKSRSVVSVSEIIVLGKEA